MKRRLIAALTAVVLAVVGGVLLVQYVSAADRRAMADLESVTVLVATELIPKGTASTGLADLTTTRTIPRMAAVAGNVTDAAELGGLVAASDILAGEQLLTARFADPATLESGPVKIPDGMQTFSVSLDRARAVGGDLTPGATVGVFLSSAEKPYVTHLTVHKVLVTKVDDAAAAPQSDGEAAQPPAVDAKIQVTLATTATDAEKIIFTAEHGTVWLSAEPSNATTTGTTVRTEKNFTS